MEGAGQGGKASGVAPPRNRPLRKSPLRWGEVNGGSGARAPGARPSRMWLGLVPQPHGFCVFLTYSPTWLEERKWIMLPNWLRRLFPQKAQATPRRRHAPFRAGRSQVLTLEDLEGRLLLSGTPVV